MAQWMQRFDRGYAANPSLGLMQADFCSVFVLPLRHFFVGAHARAEGPSFLRLVASTKDVGHMVFRIGATDYAKAGVRPCVKEPSAGFSLVHLRFN
jgi:hypothetical protein